MAGKPLGKGNGAGDRTRTYDPIITNDVLYQLSYTGAGQAISTAPIPLQAAFAALYRPRTTPGQG